MTWRRVPGLLLILAAPLLLQTAAAQGVYRWIDQEGRTVFSDRPPPGMDYYRPTLPPGPTPEQAAAARERAEQLQRQVAERDEERRRREELAAARAAEEARATPPPPAPAQDQPPWIRDHRWYWPHPVPPHYPVRPWPPPPPPPQDTFGRPRAPEFTQPRRPPEFQR
jgi:hypothetical protein